MKDKKLFFKLLARFLWSIASIVLLLHFIRMMIFPPIYLVGGHWFQDGGDLNRFSKAVATYDIGTSYQIIDYRDDSPKAEVQYLILYKNIHNDQLLMLVHAGGFPTVDTKFIVANKSKVKRTFFAGNIVTLGLGPYLDKNAPAEIGYHFPYYFICPWLLRKDIDVKGLPMEIRGFDAQDTTRWQNDKVEALIFKGTFSKVELRKLKGIIRQYPRLYIDYRIPMYGMLAVLKSKEDGKTIFLLTGAKDKDSFDEASIQELIKSFSFERELPYDPFEAKYGNSKVITTERDFGPVKVSKSEFK